MLFEHIARSSNRMADALAVLGSRLLQIGGTDMPVIWFARQDAPSGAMLPSSFPVHSLVVDGYKEWYGDISDYLANGFLPSSHYNARTFEERQLLTILTVKSCTEEQWTVSCSDA